MIKRGLRPLPTDTHDAHVGALFDLPRLSELPSEFSLGKPFIKNQIADGNDDYCSSCMTAGMSEYQEGVELFYPFSFAASKDLSNDPDEWGQNLRTAMQAHTKIGAVALSEVPQDIKGLIAPERRLYKNYAQIVPKAPDHKKQSYAQISGPYDAFDNIKATIWKFRNEERAVGTGVKFGWSLSDYYLTEIPDGGEGHAMYINGWSNDGLVYVNSAGESAGRDGTHLVSRRVVNTYAEKFGAMTFLDMPRAEMIARMHEYNKSQSVFKRFFSFLFS